MVYWENKLSRKAFLMGKFSLLEISAFLESKFSGKLKFPGNLAGKLNCWIFLLSWKPSFLENFLLQSKKDSVFKISVSGKLNFPDIFLSVKVNFLENEFVF